MTQARVPRPGRLGLGERVKRNDLRGVGRGSQIAVIGLWVLTLAVLVAVVWPGAVASVEVGSAASSMPASVVPAWFRALIILCCAALASTALIGASSSGPAQVHRRAAFIGAAISPGVLLLVDRHWAAAIIATALGLGALLSRSTMVLVRLGLIVGAWLTLLAVDLLASSSAERSGAWTLLLGLSAAVAAFGSYSAVAGAAEARTARLAALLTVRRPAVVLAIALSAGVVVALRLTVLRDLFPTPDPALWTLTDSTVWSWLLAAAVAAALIAITLRSTSVPLRPAGQQEVVAALAVLGNLHLIVGVAVLLVVVATGAVGAAEVWPGAVPALKVTGVVLLGLVVIHPRFRLTAARGLVVVAVLFLLPVTLQGAVGSVEIFAPTPVQVVIVVVAAAIGLAVARVIGVAVSTAAIVRLAVIPLVAVHAGWLLPAAWSSIGLVVAATVILISAVLAAPRPAEGAARSGQLLATASARLATVTVSLLAAPSLLDDPSLIVLGLVWLSVVMAAALCFSTASSGLADPAAR